MTDKYLKFGDSFYCLSNRDILCFSQTVELGVENYKETELCDYTVVLTGNERSVTICDGLTFDRFIAVCDRLQQGIGNPCVSIIDITVDALGEN